MNRFLLISVGVCFSGLIHASSLEEEEEEKGVESFMPEGSVLRLTGLYSYTGINLVSKPFNVGFDASVFTEDVYENDLSIEMRPDISIPYKNFNFTLKPRIQVNRLSDKDLDNKTDTTTFFNSAFASYQINDFNELSIGRQSLLWGNGQFRSPSNPFYIDSSLVNPADELLGKDFLIYTYKPDLTWEFNAISHYGNSHLDSNFEQDDFSKTFGLNVSHTGDATNTALLLSKREGKPERLSGYTNYTLNDSVLLYSEATVSKDTLGLLPERDENNVLVGFAPANEIDERYRHSVLLGGAYTFNNGLTANIEYLNTTFGFDSKEARDWRSIGSSAINDLINQNGNTAVTNLANAITPQWPQHRQNYLYLQLSKTDLNNTTDIALTYTANMDDQSGSASVSLTHKLNDDLEAYLSGTKGHGDGGTEFGNLIDYGFELGIRHYIH